MIYLKKTGGSRTTGFIATYLTVTVISLLLCLSAISICLAGEAHVDEEIIYLKKLSIEDLLKLEVTSVSKKREMLSEAAAAVFVITQEDIRRSGATSIPEALRMVPGLQVARIDANKWAITSRGFNGRFANKLLVLIDGRSVYTPLYSGVFWNVQDTFIEDVERIEVIRGPGAALWGANAVNGVINVITRQAKDTLGGLVSAGIGTEERGFGSIRYGGRLG
ncbi:MAG: TonB-dependent receptor plug domain-containing protein, partial [Thermodesulfobacteriota bacterium]|nr:TonB-dependent receptor plug domain-containing protein [Thermodesulfobacteriota bacterium]